LESCLLLARLQGALKISLSNFLKALDEQRGRTICGSPAPCRKLLTFSGATSLEPSPTIQSALASGEVRLFCGPLCFLDAEARIQELEAIESRGCHTCRTG